MRKRRVESMTGIYHVILRGIDKQDVFLDRNDYIAFLRFLKEIQIKRGINDAVIETGLCTIYCYALLHNHLHLLIRAKKMSLSETMKRLLDMFVVWYNTKYHRNGPLFQGRFWSEPVNDEAYFLMLLKYIHLNPVKAGEAKNLADYEFCSWREYLATEDNSLQHNDICDVETVLKKYPLEELKAMVEDKSDKEDMDIEHSRVRLSEDEAVRMILDISDCDNIHMFRGLPYLEQYAFVKIGITKGMTLKQASRLTSFSLSKLKRLIKSGI